MDKAVVAESDSERTEAWNNAMDIISEEVPLYPLFHRTLSTASRKGVFKEYKAAGTTGLFFLGAKLSKKS